MKAVTVGLVSALLALGCAKPSASIAAGETGAKPEQIKPAAYACSLKFAKSGLCISWKWETPATEETPGAFIFRTYALDPIDQFPVLVPQKVRPNVKLWMPSMGHGSSPVSVEELYPGTFRAKNVYFVMPGAWEIKFQILNGKQVVDEAVAPFNL